MTWEVDPQLTEIAKAVFHRSSLTVRKREGQYLLEGTPYGQVEILSLHSGGHFILAAESPPQEMDESGLSAEMVDHLRRNGLRPWKHTVAVSIRQIVYSLGVRHGPETPREPMITSPFIQPMSPGPDVIGEDRQARVHVMAALVSSVRPNSPLPLLWGPPGIGKHTTALALARTLDIDPIEMSVSKLMIPRIFQTPSELLMGTLVECHLHLTDRVLLVLSDAELFDHLPVSYQTYFWGEISRLPSRVLLLSREYEASLHHPCIGRQASGFHDRDEIRSFLRCVLGDSDSGILGSALDMMTRAATLPGFGVLPGRLRYLLDLVMTLNDHKAHPPAFTPDDVAVAIDMIRPTWEDQASQEDSP